MSDLTTVLDRIRPGHRVFVAGSSGEPTALIEAWRADPDRTRGLDIVTSAVPGINRLAVADLHPTASLTGLFMRPDLDTAHRDGRYRHLPLSYGGFARALSDGAFAFDVCIAQVSPPDETGRHSLGPAVEFLPLVMAHARETCGLINRQTPVIAGSTVIDSSTLTARAEVDTPLATYDTGPVDAVSAAIAAHVAELVEDGATLQVGLGKTPGALLRALHDRQGLKLHSGMFGDDVPGLVESGALEAGAPHRACVFVGGPDLYAWAGRQSVLSVAGCQITHGADALARLEDFVAVNSAIEVDLFGQAALEHVDGRAVSGAGGAPDFARAAKMSRGGISVVALPATGARGTRSRIVAALTAPAVVTLPRTDVDVVVTEYGIADLRGRSVLERAERLIAIADPAFRPQLAAALGKTPPERPLQRG